MIGNPMDTPKKPIAPEESEVIDEAYHRLLRYGARMLDILIPGAF